MTAIFEPYRYLLTVFLNSSTNKLVSVFIFRGRYMACSRMVKEWRCSVAQDDLVLTGQNELYMFWNILSNLTLVSFLGVDIE